MSQSNHLSTPPGYIFFEVRQFIPKKESLLMPNELRLNGKIIRLVVGFIIDIRNMDGLVYYARPDLKLGAGFGTAISIQGGPKVQE